MGSTSLYGHADYRRDQAAGVSDSDLLAKIHANPSAMGNQGIGGDLYNEIARNAGMSSGSGGGGGGGGGGGSMGAGAFNPNEMDFNPGGIDMSNTFSESDYVMGLAKERAENFVSDNSAEGGNNASIVNNIEQNVGNKGDMETNIGDGNTINGSSIGNDFSLNMGNVALNNKITQGGR